MRPAVGAAGFDVPSRRSLATVWIAAAVVLVGILVTFQLTRDPGDDHDPGRQRPGILDLGALPEPAPEIEGLALPRDRVAIFFSSAGDFLELCESLSNHDDLQAEELVVISATEGPCAHAEVVRSDLRNVARAFGMPAPRGDVSPSGYAILDSSGRIRYRTLDPVSSTLLDEVATMLRAVQ